MSILIFTFFSTTQREKSLWTEWWQTFPLNLFVNEILFCCCHIQSPELSHIFITLITQLFTLLHKCEQISLSTVWIRETNYMSLSVFFISLLIVAQHVSGNHVPIISSWQLRDVIASCWYVPWLREGCQVWLAGSVCMDALPANRSWQPPWQSPCSHGTYQREAITSRSRQLLMMGTWLPETRWATIRREIKNTKSDIQLVFLTYTGPTASPRALWITCSGSVARFWFVWSFSAAFLNLCETAGR